MPEVMDRKRSVFSLAMILKALVFMTIGALVIIFAVLVLMNAQRLGWTLGWIYVSIFATATTINLLCLGLWNPELIKRRLNPGKWVKTWDKVWAVLFGLSMIGIFVVANIEARDVVSSGPGTTWLFGFSIFVLGWTLAIWSMTVNPFFEKTVRIQKEHGHRVIDTGPYAYVRHPGYVGFLGWIISTPLLLASVWAFIPTLTTVFLFMIRTAFEDRMLCDELPGYTEYTNRVRFRLIPGLW